MAWYDFLGSIGSGIADAAGGAWDYIKKDPRIVPATVGTLGGIYGMVGSALEKKKMQDFAKSMKGPVDVNQYYQPMSEMERAALMRAIRADLATRGIPLDSSYATSLIAEKMAEHETNRYNTAMQTALAGRGQYASAMQGAYPQSNMQEAIKGAMALPNLFSAQQKEKANQPPGIVVPQDSGNVYPQDIDFSFPMSPPEREFSAPQSSGTGFVGSRGD